ncbi:MAG: hypothetical protein U0359_11460 [Byssovorax sp.]
MTVALHVQWRSPWPGAQDVSDVGTRESICRSALARWAYARIAHRIPDTCPLILER